MNSYYMNFTVPDCSSENIQLTQDIAAISNTPSLPQQYLPHNVFGYHDNHLRELSKPAQPTSALQQSSIVEVKDVDEASYSVFRCPKLGCGKTYTRRNKLREHISSKHDEHKPFQCLHESCPRTFPNRSALKRHEKTHRKQKDFECQQCKREFGRKDSLQEHLKKYCVGVHVSRVTQPDITRSDTPLEQAGEGAAVRHGNREITESISEDPRRSHSHQMRDALKELLNTTQSFNHIPFHYLWATTEKKEEKVSLVELPLYLPHGPFKCCGARFAMLQDLRAHYERAHSKAFAASEYEGDYKCCSFIFMCFSDLVLHYASGHDTS